MSSNVGLSTPRGSGTSGYVQRNSALLKKLHRTSAPYPPVLGVNGSIKQRMPDKKIIEHEQRRDIEVKVMEERERLEEENERIEEEQKSKKKNKTGDEKAVEETVLDDEEIEEWCDALRKKLLAELDEELESGKRKKIDGRTLKDYQVHELAEAKIEQTKRLRRAFGLQEDRETGEVSSARNWVKRE